MHSVPSFVARASRGSRRVSPAQPAAAAGLLCESFVHFRYIWLKSAVSRFQREVLLNRP